MKIPFFKPTFGILEEQALVDVLRSGWTVQGPLTEEFERQFAQYVGAEHAVFVDSGTSALFLALKVQERFSRSFRGEEIHVPSLTFVSDVEVVINAEARPGFVDVDAETFCINNMEPFRPTIGVHLTGNLANCPALVYDSAHRIERDDVKGSHTLWCYSFYATKNMSTVQGGMIALNDGEKAQWLKKARDHGTSKGTRERYTQKTPLYEIEFPGWRMKADDLRAALGLVQLKKLDAMNQARNEIVKRYNEAFLLKRTGNHLYPVLVKDREAFFNHMFEREIQCSVHFLPLHKMKAFASYYQGNPLPNTEYIGNHIASIPLYPQMTEDEQYRVIDAVMTSGQLIY